MCEPCVSRRCERGALALAVAQKRAVMECLGCKACSLRRGVRRMAKRRDVCRKALTSWASVRYSAIGRRSSLGRARRDIV